MVKWQKSILVCFMMMTILTGCATGKSDVAERGTTVTKETFEQISQEHAKELIDSEKNYIILDVRTKEEYNEGHIKGAICIANETIDDGITKTLTDKKQLILVYCRSGNRSVQAATKLAELGYSNVKEFGGINTWKYETE